MPAAKTAAKSATKAPKKTAEKKKLIPLKKKEAFEDASVKLPEKKTAAKSAPAAASKSKSAEPYFYANGKRKTSIALVRLYSNGKGTITVNERTFENYFPVFTDQDKIMAPLKLTNTLKMFDVSVRVKSGGIHSQAEAIRHGISKALLVYHPEFRTTLKPMGFLTRDPRMKERKKYGLKRARRAPQWAKR